MERIRTYSSHLILLFLLVGCLLVSAAVSCGGGAELPPQETLDCENSNYIERLECLSMLHQASNLARDYSGQRIQWRHPYAEPQPIKATETASVWFTAYPAATIGRPDQTVLETLGDGGLWEIFREIGIRAIHTGPLKRAGGIAKCQEADWKYTPSIDGGFDRISLEIDPAFGTEEQYRAMVKIVKNKEAIVIGDIVPGHTGKGADFLLAVRNYEDYPGLFHMIEIEKDDWDLLPDVGEDDSRILDCDQVKKLKDKYIVGALQRVIFQKQKKPTNWSATGEIEGMDGKVRRWVYLHYFKSGQPTLNWLDPSFAAQRLVVGDIIRSTELGAEMLRLDANGFLGIEKTGGHKIDETACQDQEYAWSEGHPLSIVSNKEITMFMRKLGGFTFQELNLTLDDIKGFSEASDLSYDFITRPASVHALITGDAGFLRMMMRKMHEKEIDPVSLIHGLQNHDELTYELVDTAASDSELAVGIRTEAYEKVTINLKELKELRDDKLTEERKKTMPWWNIEGDNGICGTMTGIIAAALRDELRIKDPYDMTDEQKKQVKEAHLLLVMFNAMQPGVLAISGWDLVGALPITNVYLQETDNGPVKKLVDKDNDCRWLNRGAYDLMGFNADAEAATIDPLLPKAVSLYGTLPEQLLEENRQSFVYKLKKMLEIRERECIHLAKQLRPPEPENFGVVLMIHVPRPENIKGGEPNWVLQITAINFGSETLTETMNMKQILKDRGVDIDVKGLRIFEMFSNKQVEDVSEDEITVEDVSEDEITIELDAREGKVLFLRK